MPDVVAEDAVKKCEGRGTYDINGRHACLNPGVELHTCPYKVQINDDKETLCNCCEACTTECSDDI